jgi:hypothetical protein
MSELCTHLDQVALHELPRPSRHNAHPALTAFELIRS